MNKGFEVLHADIDDGWEYSIYFEYGYGVTEYIKELKKANEIDIRLTNYETKETYAAGVYGYGQEPEMDEVSETIRKGQSTQTLPYYGDCGGWC